MHIASENYTAQLLAPSTPNLHKADQDNGESQYHPQYVNFIKTFEISEKESLLLVTCLNQLTIFSLTCASSKDTDTFHDDNESEKNNGEEQIRAEVRRQVIIDDVGEDLRVAEVMPMSFV